METRDLPSQNRRCPFDGRKGRNVGACTKIPEDIHGRTLNIGRGRIRFTDLTIQITVDHRQQIGTIKPIGSLKAFLIHMFKILEMILNTLAVGRILRPTGMVGGIFQTAFTSIWGSILYLSKGRFHHHVKIFEHVYSPHLYTIHGRHESGVCGAQSTGFPSPGKRAVRPRSLRDRRCRSADRGSETRTRGGGGGAKG